MKNNNFFNGIKNLSGGAISDDDIKKAKNGDISSLIKTLPGGDADKIKAVLSDESKRKAFLESDEVQKILKMLGGKNNG